MKGTEVVFRSDNETLHATLYGDPSSAYSAGVVLCPPHPLYGGNRHDTRIVKVAQELAGHDLLALCIDYGSYGKGVREVQYVMGAVAFLREKGVSSSGLFGYSFGSVVASNVAAASSDIDGFVAMSILRQVNGLTAKLDSDCPKLFVHGRRDEVASYVDFERLFAETKGVKQKLILDTDHFYMDNYPTVITIAAETIRRFFEESLKRK